MWVPNIVETIMYQFEPSSGHRQIAHIPLRVLNENWKPKLKEIHDDLMSIHCTDCCMQKCSNCGIRSYLVFLDSIINMNKTYEDKNFTEDGTSSRCKCGNILKDQKTLYQRIAFDMWGFDLCKQCTDEIISNHTYTTETLKVLYESFLLRRDIVSAYLS